MKCYLSVVLPQHDKDRLSSLLKYCKKFRGKILDAGLEMHRTPNTGYDLVFPASMLHLLVVEAEHLLQD